jgi:hypothetical protein
MGPAVALAPVSHSVGAAPPAPPPPGAPEPVAAPLAHAAGGPDAGAAPLPTRLGPLPPLKVLNKKQVKLDFDVAKYGPSGLGGVDVYVTTDEGATWEKSRTPPEVSLPVSAEATGASPAPVRGSVTVEMPQQGVVYGFYLVVKSRAGRGKPPPRPGDAPHVRIEVDTTMPLAELYAPQQDPGGRRDTLVLTWKAEDKNLAPSPVTLEWAAQVGGPWEFIGGPQLPNTGRYNWQIGSKVPHRVYLRLTVRDVAGNVAVAQTPEPVLIDLSEPEVSNVGVSVGAR